jgi:hypothetical protein
MIRRSRTAQVSLVLVALALVGCGKKPDASTKTKDDAATGPAAAPIAMPVLGVDQIKRFNYIYEAGAPAHEKAAAAYRKKDWATVRIQAEAAIAKDPLHLGAHRLLAAALAETGEPAAAVDHLVTAIAGDYLQFAPTLADDDLKTFMASPHGKSVAALAAKIHDDYARRITGGLWLVGRRSPFKWPKEMGVAAATSRGELYAFDRETRRFFRLTHTDHQVVGFVRPAAGAEVTILGFDKIDRPRPDDAKTDGDDTPPLFARAWIQVLDTAAWTPITTKRIELPPAREVTVGYGAGDQLLVSTAQATGRWSVDEPAVSSVDRATGKLTKVATPPATSRIVVSLDEGHLVRIPDVDATWAGAPPVTANFRTGQGDKPVQIPESGQASQASIAVSPGRTHVAFATAVDPCAKEAAPSLYVAEVKTGVYKHLLSAKSRFPTRWVDASVLAYEDGDGAIRLWDATTGREATRLEDKSGIALDVLSLAPAPLCKQAPPTVDAAGSGEEPLPPEEPGGAVTSPQ